MAQEFLGGSTYPAGEGSSPVPSMVGHEQGDATQQRRIKEVAALRLHTLALFAQRAGELSQAFDDVTLSITDAETANPDEPTSIRLQWNKTEAGKVSKWSEINCQTYWGSYDRVSGLIFNRSKDKKNSGEATTITPAQISESFFTAAREPLSRAYKGNPLKSPARLESRQVIDFKKPA